MIDYERIDLTDSQLKLIRALLRQHVPNRAVLAFGSRVRHASRHLILKTSVEIQPAAGHDADSG